MKWSKGDSMQALARFFNEGLSFDVMLQRVKEMVRQLPSDMAAVIKFNCLTGLRPAEAVESVRLIKERGPRQVLQARAADSGTLQVPRGISKADKEGLRLFYHA